MNNWIWNIQLIIKKKCTNIVKIWTLKKFTLIKTFEVTSLNAKKSGIKTNSVNQTRWIWNQTRWIWGLPECKFYLFANVSKLLKMCYFHSQKNLDLPFLQMCIHCTWLIPQQEPMLHCLKKSEICAKLIIKQKQ